MKKAPSRYFLLVFVLVGVVILFLGGRVIVRAHASQRWPTVEGTVVASSVQSKSGNKGGTTYHAEVLYEYRVDGELYSSSTVAFGAYGSSNPAPARKTVNRYPRKSKVVVYYAPEDPTLSTLEPGVSAKSFFLAGIGLLFSSVGVVMFICSKGWSRSSKEGAQKEEQPSSLQG